MTTTMLTGERLTLSEEASFALSEWAKIDVYAVGEWDTNTSDEMREIAEHYARNAVLLDAATARVVDRSALLAVADDLEEYERAERASGEHDAARAHEFIPEHQASQRECAAHAIRIADGARELLEMIR